MKTLNITTIVGARPQFIKAAPVSRALQNAGHREYLVHTGQHYDHGMSKVFFEELNIPEPDVNLGVGSGSHAVQTGNILVGIEEVLMSQRPDWVLVYGDTNSTLAGALAAVKLHIPVAHIESGLRSFNREMPEEINRVITDRVSNLLFCPTETAVENLEKEGITKGVHNVGDVMYDSVLYNIELAEQQSKIMDNLNLSPRSYALATLHRPENTDNADRLKSVCNALEKISRNGTNVILPIHPRTKKSLELNHSSILNNQSSIKIADPVPYLDMLLLEKNAKVILTDSGGMQKEAYWFRVPCVTMRNETEWLETVDSGWNTLVGADPDHIIDAAESANSGSKEADIYGSGKASEHIADIISAN